MTQMNVDEATGRLVSAVERWCRAVDADPSANYDAEVEYAHEMVKLSARELVRATDAQPADRQPVGWRERGAR